MMAACKKAKKKPGFLPAGAYQSYLTGAFSIRARLSRRFFTTSVNLGSSIASSVFNAICATANVAPYFCVQAIGSGWTAVLSDDVSTEVQPFGVVFSIPIYYHAGIQSQVNR